MLKEEFEADNFDLEILECDYTPINLPISGEKCDYTTPEILNNNNEFVLVQMPN